MSAIKLFKLSKVHYFCAFGIVLSEDFFLFLFFTTCLVLSLPSLEKGENSSSKIAACELKASSFKASDSAANNSVSTQGTLRKVSHLSISLVIIIALAFADQLRYNGLSELQHHVWSALLLCPTMAPPPYFVYISLSAIPFSIYFCFYRDKVFEKYKLDTVYLADSTLHCV